MRKRDTRIFWMVFSIILIFGLLNGLSGCASQTPLEELKDQAMISGDWSEVEAREKILIKRKARSAPICPNDLTAVCEVRGRDKRCSCLSRNEFRRWLEHVMRRW